MSELQDALKRFDGWTPAKGDPLGPILEAARRVGNLQQLVAGLADDALWRWFLDVTSPEALDAAALTPQEVTDVFDDWNSPEDAEDDVLTGDPE